VPPSSAGIATVEATVHRFELLHRRMFDPTSRPQR
jgi:hypothetical protein